MKKRRKKKSETPRQPPAAGKPAVRDISFPSDDSGGKTDYGGIPDVDLKKNLGCG